MFAEKSKKDVIDRKNGKQPVSLYDFICAFFVTHNNSTK